MASSSQLASIHRLVWTALLSALTAVGALISLPVLPPVPITLQTLFVPLAGLILGPRGGLLAMSLYLAAGCLGLPVFAGGKAGFAALLGPTGGFLLGFLPGAWLAGFGGGLPLKPFWVIVFFCLAGSLATLALGATQLAQVLQISLTKAVALGVVPFLPGAVLKSLAAAGIYRFLALRRLAPVC
jgi:biotin transport system substrate-specific component